MLVRLLLSAAMLTLPFGLLALLSGRAEGLVWLMIPFIALVPVFLVASIVLFIPIEKVCGAQDWPPLPPLLVVGAALGGLVAFLAAYFGNKRSTILREIASGDLEVIGSLVGLVVLGAAMAAVWHYSQRVAEHIGIG